jgi:choline-sulfatase
MGRVRSLVCLPAVLALAACDSAPAEPAKPSAAPLASSPAPSASVAPPEKPRPFNVIVITIDSLRADHMAWNGYPKAVAPRLEAFAKEAVNYTRFSSLSSYTAMTFGGFIAGKYPSETARSGYFFSSYPPEVETFAEILQKGGVKTMSAHGHWYFGKEKVGFDQGFDQWELVSGLKKSNTTDQNVTSPAHLELAKSQLGNNGLADRPFFAWYHFMDPHDMYMGHDGPDFGKGAEALYDGEVHYTDEHVGKLLAFIAEQPWAKHTAILVSGDHGETFGEHEMYRHGFQLWQALTWVPLLVKIPGAAPRAIAEPRGGIDLVPTILELLGQKPAAGMQGQSLVAEIQGASPERRAVVSDLPRTSDNDRRRSMIWGKHKIIAHGDDEYFKLYDLEADPKELDDLASKDKALLQEMKKRYEDVSKTIKEVCPESRKLMGKDEDKPC